MLSVVAQPDPDFFRLLLRFSFSAEEAFVVLRPAAGLPPTSCPAAFGRLHDSGFGADAFFFNLFRGCDALLPKEK